ncbi:Hypp2606 [Branchiostoma lanceolatum]|uniref:Hypp2606 protein n=1 Tax=Branchiostoma lanceolatum TaxID=7740 RepID=A0A8K0ER44_BRALA|nr:Hypp2606 [Branchiostoma lanceolatum]
MSTGPKLAVSQPRRLDQQISTTVSINLPVRMAGARKEKQKKKPVVTKELVREDVYLTDSTTPRPAPSPMAAAHSRRMREMGYPVEMMADKTMAKRTMRDTVQEILEHRTLDRQLQIEMNRQRTQMQAEARQLRKNLRQLKSKSTSQNTSESTLAQHSKHTLHASVQSLPNKTRTRSTWKVATGRIVALKRMQRPSQCDSTEDAGDSGEEEARLCYAIDAVRMSQDSPVLPPARSTLRRPVRRHTVDESGTKSRGKSTVPKQRWHSVSGDSGISPDLMASFPSSPTLSRDGRNGRYQRGALADVRPSRESSVHSVRELGLNWQLPSRDITSRSTTPGKRHRDHKPLTSELDRRRKGEKTPEIKVREEKQTDMELGKA